MSTTATAAIATHYYAGFLVGAEAAWLLYRTTSRRATLVAIGGVAAAAAALLPIALHQRSTGAAAFISESSLARRLAQIPKQFALGYEGPLEIVTTLLAALVAAYAVLRLIASAPGRERHRGLVFAGLGVATVAAALALAIAGADYLLARNVLAAWLPIGVAVAAGLAAGRAMREGLAGAAVLCALGAFAVIGVAREERYQRDDWRGAAAAIGRADMPRAIIVTPASGRIPLGLYLEDARLTPEPGVNVKEIVFVGLAPRLPGEEPEPPRPPTVGAAGFTETSRVEADTYTVVKQSSPAGTTITPVVGASSLDGRPAITFIQRPR